MSDINKFMLREVQNLFKSCSSTSHRWSLAIHTQTNDFWEITFVENLADLSHFLFEMLTVSAATDVVAINVN